MPSLSFYSAVSSEAGVGSAPLSSGITHAGQTSEDEEGKVCSSTCHVEQCGGDHEVSVDYATETVTTYVGSYVHVATRSPLQCLPIYLQAFSENKAVSVLCIQVPLSSSPVGLLNTQPKEREYPPSIQCSVACEETSSSPGLLVGTQQAFRSLCSACNGLLVCQWQLHTAVDLQIDGE